METDQYRANILSNLAHIHQRINAACKAVGRESSSVRLLLATKTVAHQGIRIAVEAGETLIGENRMQEYVEKSPYLTDLHIDRHFIGHLQTNKVKDALKYVSCIQSVDRLDLVKKLDQRLRLENRTMDIMVQVNTSFEESKFGLDPEYAVAFVKEVLQYDTLTIKGFMTIGLFDAEAEKVRPSYQRLRSIRDQIISEGLLPPSANELSMGMSNDLETAIAEGATMVRIGTAVFGQRVYPDSHYWNESDNK